MGTQLDDKERELIQQVLGFGVQGTSPIEHPQSNTLVLVRDRSKVSELQRAIDCTLGLFAIVPHDLSIQDTGSAQLWYTTHPDWYYAVVHNALCDEFGIMPQPLRVGIGTQWHESIVINEEGVRVVWSPDGRAIRPRHIGGVNIGNYVRIGPYSVIYRGFLNTTTLDDYVTLGAFCGVGHGCRIGHRSILTERVSLGGSSIIGADCILGMTSIVRDGVRIHDGVLLGAGATLLRDTNQPGIWAGTPAVWRKDWKPTTVLR